MAKADKAMGRAGGVRGTGIAALAGMALLLAACASPGPSTVPTPAPVPQAPPPVERPVVQAPPAPVDDGKVRVAVLVPLSGRGAGVGQSMLDAAQMALFDVADERLVLVPRDTGGSPEGAVAAAREAIAEGADLILGPLFGPDATVVKPVAAAAGVPVLTFSNDWTVAGGGMWVLGFQPQDQVARVAGHAAAQGFTTFGVLAPATPYGQAVVESLRGAVERNGGQITKVELYSPGQTDVTEAVKRLSDYDLRRQALAEERAKLTALAGQGDQAADRALRRLANAETFGDLPFRAVMIAEGGQSLRELASLFPFFDVDPGPVKFLGTGLWDEPGIGREPALLGGWFAAPPPDARQEFEARFEALYGQRPHRLATLAYDATALAAVLARTSTDNRPYEPGDLTNPNGFAGIDGIFRLLPGGLTERALAVMEVTRTGTIIIDPARQTFEDQAF
ncbi:MAG: hypothetical protein RLY86_1280 [Pseudomonadota bacterium]|jgi:ABC-type branched-subunit amino acid transport system substrate-binding protein